MKYNYQKEAILKWENINIYTIEETYPLAKTEEEYHSKYSCNCCKQFNFKDYEDNWRFNNKNICVLAYNTKNRGRYCVECIEWLEINDPDFACGLEGFNFI